MIDVTVIGTVKRRRVLTRAGARPGDDLYVSGTLGAAAAGLARCSREGAAALGRRRSRGICGRSPGSASACCSGATARAACIDLSDGLADGVRQIGEASGVGAVIDADALPIEPGARRCTKPSAGAKITSSCSRCRQGCDRA